MISNIIKKIISLPSLIFIGAKSVLKELKFVEWLSRGKTLRYAFLMFIILGAGTIFLLLADQLFVSARNFILFGI